MDSLPGDQAVHVRVHAQDAAGEGVLDVGMLVVAAGATEGAAQLSTTIGELVSGTATDGWWDITVLVPQGTPPGRYVIDRVAVTDKAHWETYTPPSSPSSGIAGTSAFSAGTVQTMDGAPWDGVITVMPHDEA